MNRWENMDPAKRAQMQALFEKTRDMDPDQRRETFALFRALQPLDQAQRQDLLKQWKSMSPAQRQEWVQAQRAEHPRRLRRGRRGGD